jgi:hypothetical protein
VIGGSSIRVPLVIERQRNSPAIGSPSVISSLLLSLLFLANRQSRYTRILLAYSSGNAHDPGSA